jgi:hypothetical protein
VATRPILHEIAHHFARYTRPDDYIDRTHCCECAEHYAELLDVTVDDLRKEHVGDGAWDPTCFLTPGAFRYYFPAMARIADEDRGWIEMLAPRLSLWYVDSFDDSDRDLVRRLLEEWWGDPQTPEWTRLAVERALDHYPDRRLRPRPPRA